MSCEDWTRYTLPGATKLFSGNGTIQYPNIELNPLPRHAGGTLVNLRNAREQCAQKVVPLAPSLELVLVNRKSRKYSPHHSAAELHRRSGYRFWTGDLLNRYFVTGNEIELISSTLPATDKRSLIIGSIGVQVRLPPRRREHLGLDPKGHGARHRSPRKKKKPQSSDSTGRESRFGVAERRAQEFGTNSMYPTRRAAGLIKVSYAVNTRLTT
ncbi:hypothetical protein FB451DRAFT_1189961 [Mycena latifolia]|nr:hypothetical protein FB451DRAFT_1189961 [Mycena latifolia]